MAFGVISSFAHQRVTLGTDIALDITITGNPDYAYIEGLLEGFYTNWKDPTLEVRGAASRLITNVPFTVKALKGTETPLSRSGLFSVVPAAPVITNPGSQQFIRGFENGFNVNISNSPSKVSAVGPWVGMKYETHPKGIRIFGIVPDVSHAVPSADQTIRVTAESGALTDNLDIDFALKTPFLYSAVNGDDIYRIKLNHSNKSVSSDLNFDTNIPLIKYLASDSDYLYIHDNTPHKLDVFRVPRNTSNGASVSATLVINNNHAGYGLAIDGNDLYRATRRQTNADNIDVFGKSPVATFQTPNRSFFFSPVNMSNRVKGIAIDGDEVIIIADNKLQWYDKNPQTTSWVKPNRELTLPSSSYEDIEVVAHKILATDPQSKKITLIDIETGNVDANYTIPSTLNGMYALTMQPI